MNSPIVDLRRRVQSITWPQALSVARIKPIHLNRASLLIGVVGAAALYFMGIGRARYQSTSDFLVRQPLPPAMAAPSVVGALLGGPAMLGSLEDGRYLAVYLHSPEVMQRVFVRLLKEGRYQRRAPDVLSGIGSNANTDQQLAFFRRQVQVWPQELSGVIQLTTTGLDPATAVRLNQLLLQEAQQFVNQMNQNISRDQLNFAQQEVERARRTLNQATDKLNIYKARYGQLDPVQESVATSSYITALEAKLVELKVEEASLKRQFRDPKAPEVQFAADQVQELQKQIQAERQTLASPRGRNLGGRASEAMKLQNEVIFATESLRAAMTAVENSRMESQRQLKFLVMLSVPQKAASQNWDWRWKGFAGAIGISIALMGITSFVSGVNKRI
jgi:capsular polysaccharide transport system permease protein